MNNSNLDKYSSNMVVLSGSLKMETEIKLQPDRLSIVQKKTLFINIDFKGNIITKCLRNYIAKFLRKTFCPV